MLIVCSFRLWVSQTPKTSRLQSDATIGWGKTLGLHISPTPIAWQRYIPPDQISKIPARAGLVQSLDQIREILSMYARLDQIDKKNSLSTGRVIARELDYVGKMLLSASDCHIG